MAGLYNREARFGRVVRVEPGGIIPGVVGEGLVTRYSFTLSIGVAAGLLWLIRTSRTASTPDPTQPGPNSPSQRINVGLAALAGGLFGARLAFVLAHFGYYLTRPLESLAFWQGGLAWAGGAVGAVLALLVLSRLKAASFWSFADLIAIPAMWVSAGAWMGCYLDRCAYGIPLDRGWWAIRASNWIGDVSLRWPTQLAGSMLCLLGVAGLMGFQRIRPGTGASGCISLAWIAAVSTGLSLTRADPIWLIFGVRLDTLASIAVLLPSLGFLGWHAYQDQRGRNRCLAST